MKNKIQATMKIKNSDALLQFYQALLLLLMIVSVLLQQVQRFFVSDFQKTFCIIQEVSTIYISVCKNLNFCVNIQVLSINTFSVFIVNIAFKSNFSSYCSKKCTCLFLSRNYTDIQVSNINGVKCLTQANMVIIIYSV